MNTLATVSREQLRELIDLQNKTHKRGFIRSLEGLVLLSPSAWKKRKFKLRPNAIPTCEMSMGFDGRVVRYGLYAADQVEPLKRVLCSTCRMAMSAGCAGKQLFQTCAI